VNRYLNRAWRVRALVIACLFALYPASLQGDEEDPEPWSPAPVVTPVASAGPWDGLVLGDPWLDEPSELPFADASEDLNLNDGLRFRDLDVIRLVNFSVGSYQPSDFGRATSPQSKLAPPSLPIATQGAAPATQPGQAPSTTQTQPASPTTPTTVVATSFGSTPPQDPGSDLISGGEARLISATETAQILKQSVSIPTIEVRRRSPIDFDPYVRGYHFGQNYTQADGALWRPVRSDLDTALSKLDPSLIDNVIVIPGPYGLRYGPGFAFIDVVTSATPRYENAPEVHNRMGVTTRGNGGQFYGRDTVYGGGSDWGFAVNYGNRVGSDYKSGNGRKIPGSYSAQNFLGQLGFDLSEDSRIEFRYNRVDQTDTEYAGQFFDVDFLGSDAYSLNLVHEDPGHPWDRLVIGGWYNRTRFVGSTDRSDQKSPGFNVIDRVEDALGAGFRGHTNGDITSIGGRSVFTFGDDEEQHVSLGADFRYLSQSLEEMFDVTGNPSFGTNMPGARMADPGLFAEWSIPVGEYWTTALGGRVDWAHTAARAEEVRATTSLPGGTSELMQNDVLYSFYLTNDVVLTDNLNGRFGFGHGQRPPTLLERYADGIFLGIIQSGFSRVIGDPTLRKERAWQLDASLSYDNCGWRGRLSGFHSWILDYVTYTGNEVSTVEGARLLRSINAELATLTGFEMYGERDLTERLTAFGSLRYVDGRDREIDMPLAAIYPLEGRAGLRLVDRTGGNKWGLEFGARIVDNQDRLGALRIGTTSVTDIITLEESTPGFSVLNLRGYLNVTDNLHVVAGIDNLTDRNYLEHLSLRLPDTGRFVGTRVLEPGLIPFVNIEWVH
jgi:outer membrane receptor protein involved in Fe transport